MRSAETRERGHDVHSVAAPDFLGKVIRVLRVRDYPQTVAQPLNDGAAGENAALERVFDRSVLLGGGNRGEQSVAALHRLVTRVCEEEAARAVGDLNVARVKAALTEERRLLVARDAADRHLRAHDLGFAVDLAAAFDLGQHTHGYAEQSAEFSIPRKRVNIIQHCARGVGAVGNVNPSARQLPHEPCVDCAEKQLAVLSLFARARYVVEYPFNLCAAEIRVRFQTRRLLDIIAVSVLNEPVADICGAAALPDDRIADGLARALFPDNGGFALVSDADPRDLIG